ncbi:MAG: alpha/beta fold hydrolase [Pseudonocardia sp.]
MTSYVLVHGGFTDGWYWAETAELLEKAGHRVHVADLPSTGTSPAGLGGLAEDAAEVRRLVAAAGEPVVLVGHSYGGMVITELADDPGVVHSVYVSAFWPQRGQAITQLLPALPDWIVPTDDGTAARVTDDVARAVEVLCAELDPARVPEWQRHSLYSAAAVLGTPSSAPDRTHPTTYVVLEKDKAVPAEVQEAMAAQADHVRRLATSHQPMLADPDGLAAILTRVPT